MEFKIENLSKTIGDKLILSGLNLSLKKGDTLNLKGSNGSGKTTLLKIIAGFDKNYEGKIEFDKALTIGYVPQDIVLFEDLSVKDNLKAFC
ncbi:MAG: ATP-binding cassette domain-containing protein, partial [Catonella sp.]